MKEMTVIQRVMKMEEYFDTVRKALKGNRTSLENNQELKEMVEALKSYQESGQWLKDFECDECGRLPCGLKRGVLSEDGLYNLINDLEMCYSHQGDCKV